MESGEGWGCAPEERLRSGRHHVVAITPWVHRTGNFATSVTLAALTIAAMYARIIKVHRTIPNQQEFLPQKWACGAAGSALPWHGRGRRFDPDQVHQISQQLRPDV